MIPLGSSAFFSDVISAIDLFSDGAITNAVPPGLQLKEIRKQIRQCLYDGCDSNGFFSNKNIPFKAFLDACFEIRYCLLAIISGRFPVFLVPSNGFSIHQLEEVNSVRIFWDDVSWYLEKPNGRRLFSFDLPKELFDLYADEGTLARRAALNLKQEMMSTLQAIAVIDGRAKVITFELDRDWIDKIRERYRR